MASTSAQTVPVPQREPEKIENPESSRFSSPEAQPERQPFRIRLVGTVPN